VITIQCARCGGVVFSGSDDHYRAVQSGVAPAGGAVIEFRSLGGRQIIVGRHSAYLVCAECLLVIIRDEETGGDAELITEAWSLARRLEAANADAERRITEARPLARRLEAEARSLARRLEAANAERRRRAANR
jgi:hypothetical protein